MLTLGGQPVPAGLVVGTGTLWEARVTIRRAYGFPDGPMAVTVRPTLALTSSDREFAPTQYPLGRDLALVVLDRLGCATGSCDWSILYN